MPFINQIFQKKRNLVKSQKIKKRRPVCPSKIKSWKDKLAFFFLFSNILTKILFLFEISNEIYQLGALLLHLNIAQ